MEVEHILNVLGAGKIIQDNFGRAMGSSVVWTAFMSGFHPGVEQSILGGVGGDEGLCSAQREQLPAFAQPPKCPSLSETLLTPHHHRGPLHFAYCLHPLTQETLLSALGASSGQQWRRQAQGDGKRMRNPSRVLNPRPQDSRKR